MNKTEQIKSILGLKFLIWNELKIKVWREYMYTLIQKQENRAFREQISLQLEMHIIQGLRKSTL